MEYFNHCGNQWMQPPKFDSSCHGRIQEKLRVICCRGSKGRLGFTSGKWTTGDMNRAVVTIWLPFWASFNWPMANHFFSLHKGPKFPSIGRSLDKSTSDGEIIESPYKIGFSIGFFIRSCVSHALKGIQTDYGWSWIRCAKHVFWWRKTGSSCYSGLGVGNMATQYLQVQGSAPGLLVDLPTHIGHGYIYHF